MKLDTKIMDPITAGCLCEIRFNKRSIWNSVEAGNKCSYQARCFLVGLFGAYTELQYNFALSANLTGSSKNRQTSSWFFMYDSEEVALKHLLRVESRNRSPCPREHSSAHNSPSRSPPLLHHYNPNDGSSSPCISHRHQHYGLSSSPRNSPFTLRTSNHTVSPMVSPENERFFLGDFASSGISNHSPSPRSSLHQQDFNHISGSRSSPSNRSPSSRRTHHQQDLNHSLVLPHSPQAEPPDISPTTLFLTPPTYEEATSQSP